MFDVLIVGGGAAGGCRVLGYWVLLKIKALHETKKLQLWFIRERPICKVQCSIMCWD